MSKTNTDVTPEEFAKFLYDLEDAQGKLNRASKRFRKWSEKKRVLSPQLLLSANIYQLSESLNYLGIQATGLSHHLSDCASEVLSR